MNRRERRAQKAELRVPAPAYDFRAMAAASGLPFEVLEMLPANLRRAVAKELCPPDNAPALARADPVRVAAWIGSYTESWFRQPEAEPIACRAGCAHCCRIVPEISDGEAMLLRSAIARLPEIAQLEIAAAVAAAADAVRAAGGEAAAAWPLPCPLLGKDNRCQVYEDRPSACRAWASTDVAPCESGVGTPMPFQALFARGSLMFFLDIFGLSKQPLPLALERPGR
jgi:Fe-S-cluster containining protein